MLGVGREEEGRINGEGKGQRETTTANTHQNIQIELLESFRKI